MYCTVHDSMGIVYCIHLEHFGSITFNKKEKFKYLSSKGDKINQLDLYMYIMLIGGA